MGRHIIFRGSRTDCATWLPFAKTRLRELLRWTQRHRLREFSRRFDLPGNAHIRLTISRSEEIIEIQAGQNGYYCLGDLGDLSQAYISASRTGIGAFFPRGEYQGRAGALPSLFEVGNGVATVFGDLVSGEGEWFETRDGVVFRPLDNFFYYIPGGQEGATAALFVKGAVVDEGAGRLHTYGLGVASFIEEDVTHPAYFYTKDGGVSFGYSLFGTSQMLEHGRPNLWRVDPSTLVAFVPVFKASSSDEFLVDAVPYFALSVDNGDTWTIPDVNQNEVITNLRGDATNTEFSRSAYDFVRKGVLGDGRPILTISARSATASIFDGLPAGTDEDGETHIFVAPRGTTNFQHVASFAYNFGGGPAEVPFTHGVPVIQVTQGGVHTLLVGTADATGWSSLTLPWKSTHTGLVRPIDPLTLGVPAYNEATGTYDLFVSHDIGQTWQKRAVIRSDAPVPRDLPDTINTLTRFAVLSILRKSGAPASTFPGQPWVGDGAITPPWVE